MTLLSAPCFQYYANRSSIVTSLWTMLRCTPSATPKVVTNVFKSDFVVLTWVRKTSIRARSDCSYTSLIRNGVVENFISQRLMVRSALSISRSICAPFSAFSVSMPLPGIYLHEEASVAMPEMPNFALIWFKCMKLRSSNASPCQDSTAWDWKL